MCDEICGYKVFRLKYEEKSKSSHYIYVKRHLVRETCPEKPSDKTLFILGIPPYCNEQSLKNFFSQYGKVRSVFVHSKPTASSIVKSPNLKKVSELLGYKVVYVVFASPTSVETVMNLDSSKPLLLCSSETFTLGLEKWCKEYNEQLLQLETEQEYYKKFIANVNEEEDKKEVTNENTSDDDGWKTVTKKGRRPGLARKESVGRKIREKEKKKQSKKELQNFYRFQIKESKKNRLMMLREKFEEDKKKIEEFKQTRKFKPF